MKTLHRLLIIVALSGICTLNVQATNDSVTASKALFDEAFLELKDQIEGKLEPDFERAVFISENAYWNNRGSFLGYQKVIDLHLVHIQSLINANDKSDSIDFSVKVNAKGRFNIDEIRYTEEEKKELYRKAITNWAIFTYITDTTTFGLSKHHPFTYESNDPFGMEQWSNSQVLNLLTSPKQRGNCFALTSFFKILADRLETGAYICTAPQHIYIQHQDPKGHLYNVELATAGHPGDGTIQTLTYTTNEAIMSNIALRKFDAKQNIGLCLVNLAKSYEHKFNTQTDDFILKCAELTLKHDPKNLNALLLKQQVLDARVTDYSLKNGINDYNQLKKDTRISGTLSILETHLTNLYELGYRQMPLDMQEILLNGFKNKEDYLLYTKDKNPSPFTTVKPKDPKDAEYVSLSHGLFQEVFTHKTLETYGHFTFNTESKAIVAIDTSRKNSFLIDPVAFAYDLGARMYDARIGRFMSVDPEFKVFPAWSPYSAFMDNPIYWTDPGGDCPICPWLDAIVDIGFALYDVGEITYDLITKGQVDPISVAALSADLISIAVPLSTGAGLAVRAGAKGAKALSKTAQLTKVSVKSADEVNEIAIKAMKNKGVKNPQAPYKKGTKVTEGVLEKDVSLVRVSGPKNVSGDFFVDPSEIKGLSPKQIKDKLSLKYEPTLISDVTIKKGTTIRTGTAGAVGSFGTKGGATQVQILDEFEKVATDIVTKPLK